MIEKINKLFEDNIGSVIRSIEYSKDLYYTKSYGEFIINGNDNILNQTVFDIYDEDGVYYGFITLEIKSVNGFIYDMNILVSKYNSNYVLATESLQFCIADMIEHRNKFTKSRYKFY